MRYNSSANINGYTAGGTGKYKYRMSVDGETAFCIQPGVPLKMIILMLGSHLFKA